MSKKKTLMVSLDTSSSNTGVAVWENGILIDYYDIDKTNMDYGEDRLNDMCTSIYRSLDLCNPDICVCEMTVVERSAQVQRMLSEIVGTIRGYSLANDIWFDRLRPTEWRKQITDNFSNLPPCPSKRKDLKKWSVESVEKLFNIKVNDNIADAILLGIAYICIWGDLSRFKTDNAIKEH